MSFKGTFPLRPPKRYMRPARRVAECLVRAGGHPESADAVPAPGHTGLHMSGSLIGFVKCGRSQCTTSGRRSDFGFNWRFSFYGKFVKLALELLGVFNLKNRFYHIFYICDIKTLTILKFIIKYSSKMKASVKQNIKVLKFVISNVVKLYFFKIEYWFFVIRLKYQRMNTRLFFMSMRLKI